MTVLVHDIPGRLRFVLPHLKRNHPGSEEARARAQAVPGVEETSVNALTGSLVVTYRSDAGTRERIIQAVACLVPGGAVSTVSHAGAGRAGSAPGGPALGAMVVDKLAEALVERAVRAAVAALV